MHLHRYVFCRAEVTQGRVNDTAIVNSVKSYIQHRGKLL
jgi:hypothetical protein